MRGGATRLGEGVTCGLGKGGEVSCVRWAFGDRQAGL